MTIPIYPVKIKGVIKSKNEKIVDIYLGANPYIELNEDRFHPIKMLFTLSLIKDEIQKYFNSWITINSDYEPVINLYFSTIYNSYQYLDTDFLNLIQAIETFHRRKYGGKYQSDDEFLQGLYCRLVNALPKNLSKDFRESLVKGKLKFANEFSLRKRLTELLKSIKSSEFPFTFVQSPRERNLFIEKVCDTRNYLTHYTEELNHTTAQKYEYPFLIEKLRTVLTICLLKEMGFEEGLLKKIILRNLVIKESTLIDAETRNTILKDWTS